MSKMWDIYIEYNGEPIYAEFVDEFGDMDQHEVVQEVVANLIIEAQEVE